MPTPSNHPKSPLILLSTLAILTVATLVTASAYFLRPSIESELTGQLTQNITSVGLLNTSVKITGRDATLSGYVSSTTEAQEAESIAKQIFGIREVENKLMIKNYSNE